MCASAGEIVRGDELDSRLAPRVPAGYDLRLQVARARTIANLWRDAVAAAHPDPAYLHEVDGEWREVTLGRGGRAPSTSSRTACSRSASGRATSFALLARTSLEWALFDFALGARRRGRRPDLREQLAARRAVRARALGGGRRARRGRRAAREGRRRRRGTCISFAELDALRERGRAYAAEHPGALDERADSIDEDDLFTFIYTSGTTGPPKACMIRHRNYYAMVQKGDEMEDRLTRARRRDAALPPARAQLRPAAAPVGGVHRLHDRVPARPAARRRPSCRACGRRSSRACRASTRRSTPPSSRSSRSRPASKRKLDRLGARRRLPRLEAAAGEAAGAARARAAAPARRPARLREGEGSASAAACASRTPAARRSRATSPSSSTRSTS